MKAPVNDPVISEAAEKKSVNITLSMRKKTRAEKTVRESPVQASPDRTAAVMQNRRLLHRLDER